MSQQHFLSSSGTRRSDYWISTLGGTGDDFAESLAIDSSDNLYISGRTDTEGSGLDDVLIAKYNPLFGVNRWQRTLGGTSNDISESTAVDSSGNVYIFGRTASTGQGSNDYLIAKYNSLGVIQWQRSLGGTGSEFGRTITVNGSDVYITGQTSSEGAGGIDLLIAKYNTSGVLQWQRTFGGTGTDRGYGVAVDSSGDVYVVGSTTSAGAGSSDALILKYNSSGTLQWSNALGGTSSDIAWAVAVDSSNNPYVAIQSNNDFVTVKYNSSGTPQWQLSLSGTGTELPRSIAVNGSDVYICGYTSSEGAGSNDILIAKYNTSGTFQWQRRLGGTGTDIGYGVAVDSSGDVYFTGKTRSEGSGLDDVLIAKIPADGSLTGTYGSFTYAASSLTPGTSTLTETSVSLSDVLSTLNDSPSALTDDTCNLSATRKSIS